MLHSLTSPKAVEENAAEKGKLAALQCNLKAKFVAPVTYLATSIGLQVSLKLVLTSWRFPCPLFIALLQNVFTVAVIKFFWWEDVERLGTPSIQEFWNVMPLPLISILNVGASIAAVGELSLPTYVVLRRASVILAFLGERYFLKTPADRLASTSVTIIFVSTLLTTDFRTNKLGQVWAILSAIANSAYGIGSRVLLARQRTKWELMWYNSAFSIPVLCIAIANDAGGGFNGVMSYEGWNHPVFILLMTAGATLGFVLNFAILANNQVNGPLSTSLLGCLKNVATTYSGILGVGSDYVWSPVNFIGLNISMVAAIVYTLSLFKKKETCGI